MKTSHQLNLGLLLLRLGLALIFIIHGWLKLQNIESTGLFFSDLKLPWPQVMAYIAGIIQFGGGILLAIGLLPRIAPLALIIVMTVAVIATLFRSFVNGYEYAFTILIMTIALFFTGTGDWTIKKLFHKGAF